MSHKALFGDWSVRAWIATLLITLFISFVCVIKYVFYNIYNWNDDKNLCFQIHLQKPIIQLVQHKLGLGTLIFLKLLLFSNFVM
jgi:hypothetical protein